MRTEVRVLGPLEVLVDGRPVALGGRRQQAVLAILVAARGRTVPAERLIAQVWADDPPPRPFASLQVYVSRLRSVLEPDRSPRAAARVLISDGGGYALRLPVDAVDAWRFVAEAGGAPDAPDSAAHAHTVLRDTLARWRGMPFAPFADEPWARPEITRLAQAHLLARERDILALIRLTHTGDAVLFAQDLAESEPLRASAWRLYALSLWTAHRSADALDVLRRHRRLLNDLGLTPDESIAEMERAILEQRQSYLDEVVGTGAGETSVLPARLPRAQPGFVARDAELAEMDRHTDGLVVITGTGGVGKTRLAIHWAHRAAGRFPGGCLYADLRGFGPQDTPAAPAEVLAAFLTALEVPDQRIPPGEAARTALLRSLLAGRRVLIVLDNAYDAEQIRPLLPGEGSSLVVVTSRNRMTGLAVSDGAHIVPLAVLDAEESRDYLYAMIGEDAVDGEPDARDTIVARCGGLPLALTLVCAGDRGTPLVTIAEKMEHGPLTDLWPVFSWSLRRLPAADAELFRHLALHPGRHVTPAAAMNLSGRPRAVTRAALSRLADVHLLDERRPGRFACHELLRTFAAQAAHRTDPPEIRDDALRRLIEYYLYSATEAAARFAAPVPPAVPGPAPDDITPEQFSDAESALTWMADAYDDILALAATAPERYRGPLAAALHPYRRNLRFHAGDCIALFHEWDVAA
ncbi:BTAD domain-containing putative transcriptional regulator [Actinoplanes sp. CA-252034]|uniref:AfsR/SARP family transcriptional regulator n=1 Tax=Actinoplanes sp. CA-252034 TaxID=3239906 RepID=UPI003D96C858